MDDPRSWELDAETVDVSAYSTLEQLPVFKRGCDSAYSWSKKFRHLAHQRTAIEIADILRNLLPDASFRHPKTGQPNHLAFTGGEPLMQQPALVDVMHALDTTGDYPRFVTVETNGTQTLRSAFAEYLADEFAVKGEEWFWSVSPKLRTSGEIWEKAIKPDVVASYSDLSPHGQLKFVVDGDERTWEEVEKATTLYRSAGVEFPVFIMPVGGLVEDQERVAANIADQAIARGYNLAARLHCYLFGNQIGT